MNGLLDTIQNLFVFAFIGLLTWLYSREPPRRREPPDTPSRPEGKGREDKSR